MISRYLVKIRDKSKIDFLVNFGTVVHVTRLANTVIFETDENNAKKLFQHTDVISVKESDKFSLALN